MQSLIRSTSRLHLSCHSMILWPETKSLSLSQRRLLVARLQAHHEAKQCDIRSSLNVMNEHPSGHTVLGDVQITGLEKTLCISECPVTQGTVSVLNISLPLPFLFLSPPFILQ